METLGSMRASVERWIGEALDVDKANEAINDAVDSLWNTIIQWNLSMFIEGPVTLNIAAAAENVSLASVADPLVAPTATTTLHEGALAERTKVVTYTLVTESGSETLESPELSLTIPVNYLATINAPAAVSGAFGWNVYVDGRLQNDQPLMFSQTYVEPPTGFNVDESLPVPPTVNNTADDLFYIRQLESSSGIGGWRAWSPADLDSLLMRRLCGMAAAESEYQRYAWDLVNMQRLEIRPAAAMALTPRYFYVKRPRKLKYDNAVIPLFNVPYEKYVRCQALSDLTLSIYEYESASAWEEKANSEKAEIIRSIIMQSRGKTQTITPY